MMRQVAGESVYTEDPALGRLGVLLAATGVFNFLVVPLLYGLDDARSTGLMMTIIVSITAGVFVGELGTMTLWLVFGPGSPLKRLVVHWSIVLGLLAAFASGMFIASGVTFQRDNVAEVCGSVILALPLVSLAIQLPLWPLRTYLGWRVHAVHKLEVEEPQKLSIRDLLLATVVAAISLTGVRILRTVGGGSAAETDSRYWLNWILAVIFITVASTISLPPSIWLMLRLKDTSKAVLAFCGYVFLLAAFALVLFALCFGRLPPDEIVVSLVFATLSFAATMTLPLIIVRDSGYRLSCTSGKRVKDNLNHELSEIG